MAPGRRCGEIKEEAQEDEPHQLTFDCSKEDKKAFGVPCGDSSGDQEEVTTTSGSGDNDNQQKVSKLDDGNEEACGLRTESNQHEDLTVQRAEEDKRAFGFQCVDSSGDQKEATVRRRAELNYVGTVEDCLSISIRKLWQRNGRL